MSLPYSNSRIRREVISYALLVIIFWKITKLKFKNNSKVALNFLFCNICIESIPLNDQ